MMIWGSFNDVYRFDVDDFGLFGTKKLRELALSSTDLTLDHKIEFITTT